LYPDSAENAFEQLAQHLERHKSKKVAKAVRAFGRSPR
jgi:hypothetical protein